jgi:hypothetical protein
MGPVSGVSFGSLMGGMGAPICGKIFAMQWKYFLGGPWIIINFTFFKKIK